MLGGGPGGEVAEVGWSVKGNWMQGEVAGNTGERLVERRSLGPCRPLSTLWILL